MFLFDTTEGRQGSRRDRRIDARPRPPRRRDGRTGEFSRALRSRRELTNNAPKTFLKWKGPVHAGTPKHAANSTAAATCSKGDGPHHVRR